MTSNVYLMSVLMSVSVPSVMAFANAATVQDSDSPWLSGKADDPGGGFSSVPVAASMFWLGKKPRVRNHNRF